MIISRLELASNAIFAHCFLRGLHCIQPLAFGARGLLYALQIAVASLDLVCERVINSLALLAEPPCGERDLSDVLTFVARGLPNADHFSMRLVGTVRVGKAR